MSSERKNTQGSSPRSEDESRKLREWWITSLENNDDGPDVSIQGPNAHGVHVVEKSAYDALAATEEGWRLKAREAMAERDELASKFNSSCDGIAAYREANHQLKRELSTARQIKRAVQDKARAADDGAMACFVAKSLDGVAGVNLAEPSAGDLERVVKAYAECRAERDEALRRLKILDCFGIDDKIEKLKRELAEGTDHKFELDARIQEAREAMADRDRWYREHQKVLDVKFELIKERDKLLKNIDYCRNSYDTVCADISKENDQLKDELARVKTQLLTELEIMTKDLTQALRAKESLEGELFDCIKSQNEKCNEVVALKREVERLTKP